MKLSALIFLFVAGFAAGGGRAGRAGRGLVASAAALPLAPLAIAAALIAYELLRPRTGENMTDLAVIATATVGGVSALLAFAGGLFGARWRRAGARR